MNHRAVFGVVLAMATALVSLPATAADLVLYDALDFSRHVVRAFEAESGLSVDVVEPGSTGETLGKIAAEGNNPQFDILWIDGSAVMVRMLENHVLRPVPAAFYRDARFNGLGRKLIPASHAFLPTGASTTAIEVNTKKVPPNHMPRSWADLVNFAGSVASKDPNFSGPAYQWLAGLFQTNGVAAAKALLRRVLTNKTISGLSSNGKVNKALLTGDASVGINQDSSIFEKIAGGEPLVAVYPKEGSVAIPQGLGIAVNCRHMAAARKFVDYVTSPAGQAVMKDGDDTDYFFIPVIRGVKAKPGRKTDIHFVFLNDKVAAAHETEWKRWYSDNFAQ